MKPEYCTQNNGKCYGCSLVNYGRDCMNAAIDYPDDPPVFRTISKETFESEMIRAKTFQVISSETHDYWMGYMRGLRKAFHGERFGTAAEHAVWCEAVYSRDEQRSQRGKGYRDGLKGVPDGEVLSGTKE